MDGILEGLASALAVLVAAFFIIQPELARIGNALWDIHTELETRNERDAARAGVNIKAARPDLFASHRPLVDNENLAPAARELLDKVAETQRSRL